MANDFFTSTNLTPADFVSVDITFKSSKLGMAKMKAVGDIKQFCSAEMYDIALSHLNSDNYNATGYEILTELVNRWAFAIFNMAVYHHFPVLMLRISNNNISTQLTDREAAPTKGQLIEAREMVLEYAYNAINDIIDYQTTNDDTITVNDESVWSKTTQYTDMQALLFTNYRDFAYFSGEPANAAFYYAARHILREVVETQINPRVTIDSETTATVTRLCKQAAALAVLADACNMLPIPVLPATVRQNIDREALVNRLGTDEVRTRIANRIAERAAAAWSRLDIELSPTTTASDGTITSDAVETPFDSSIKSATLI